MNHFLYSEDLCQTWGIILGLTLLYLAAKVVRNLYFHPLSKYPGPKLFAATSLVNTYYVFKATRIYKVSELHNKYGSVVRIGPNELSYVDERAWKDIYSSHKLGGELRKHMPPPDITGGYGLFNNPSDAEHSRIRKLLSLGFSERAIREREGLIQGYVGLMIERLRENAKAGEKLDASWWLDCLGADVAGHLAYGESFHALETSTLPVLIPTIDKLLKGLSIGLALSQYPVTNMIGRVLRELGPVERIYKAIVEEKLSQREKRLAASERGADEHQDYCSLMTRNKDIHREISPSTIKVASGDLIIAGSDTTATGLAVAIYLLLKNPSKLAILTKEIRSAFSSEEEITMVATNGLIYQSAVLSEGMRLYPAGPETTRRITSEGGNVICGEFVPEGVLVGVYHWAAGHNTAAWIDADSFVPERWLGDSRYDGDGRGVVSFWGAGPRNCLGQNFAMAHMKLVLARLIWNFDMELCRESENWMNVGASVLVYHKGPLMIKLRSIRV